MIAQNYKLMFDIKECLIMDKLNRNLVVTVKGEMIENRIFKLTLASSESHSLKTIEKVSNKLWYLQIEHSNFKKLMLMRKINMVNDLLFLEVDSENCEGCILGKQHRERLLNIT